MATLIAASPERFRLSPSQQKKSRKSYSVTEKVRILNELDASGGWVRRVAKENGIHHTSLMEWKRNQSSLLELMGNRGCRSRRVLEGKRDALHGKDIKDHLLSFVKERRENSYHVTPRMLIIEWTKIDPEGVAEITPGAARARIYRFMRRNELTFRRTTHKAQVARVNPAVIEDFVSYCNWKAQMLGIGPHCIANFDETNVYFSPPIRSTIAAKGSKTVSIRIPDSTNRCSAMLGVTMSGYKFPPFIIYQGKMTPTGRIRRELLNSRANHYPVGLMYQCQEKAWMDEVTMLEWVKQVWKPFTQRRNGAPTMLLLDWAPAHMVASVKLAIADCNTELEYIPKGYTSKCQVLDVGINKPFSDYIRMNVDQWQMKNDFDAKPRRQDVAHWIRMSWLEIKLSTITNTWQSIGFQEQEATLPVLDQGDNTDSKSVDSNAEEHLDPLAYNTCIEDSDSEEEDYSEDEYAVR